MLCIYVYMRSKAVEQNQCYSVHSMFENKCRNMINDRYANIPNINKL